MTVALRTIQAALAFLLGLATPSVDRLPVPLPPEASGAIGTFRGLGAWIDIYDDRYWEDPGAAVLALEAKGVRTLYLQTCNNGCPGPIHRPAMVGRFIDTAHDQGMRIVAWYLPGLQKRDRDLTRIVKAIRFESDTDQRFDALAVDIESRLVTPVSERNGRLLALSSEIRDAVGATYPLGAIVPPYFADWKPFPYRALATQYDVFLPMAYFTGYTNGPGAAHDEISRNIQAIRMGTGRRDVPIHVIGGIADDMDRRESRAVAQAGRRHAAIGVSLYDADTSGPEDWSQLSAVRGNPN